MDSRCGEVLICGALRNLDPQTWLQEAGEQGYSVVCHIAVLSHPNRGMSRECEASTVPSHGNETPTPLTWWDSYNGMRTCLMIGEITDAADCLTTLGTAGRSDSRASRSTRQDTADRGADRSRGLACCGVSERTFCCLMSGA